MWRQFFCNSLIREEQANSPADRLIHLDHRFASMINQADELNINQIQALSNYLIELEQPLSCCDECPQPFHLIAILLSTDPEGRKLLIQNQTLYNMGSYLKKKQTGNNSSPSINNTNNSIGSSGKDDVEKCYEKCEATGVAVGIVAARILPGKFKIIAPVVSFATQSACKTGCRKK